MSSQPNPIDLQKHLAGVDYPADRDSLVKAARENGADDALIDQLQEIPERTYSGPDQVSEAVFHRS